MGAHQPAAQVYKEIRSVMMGQRQYVFAALLIGANLIAAAALAGGESFVSRIFAQADTNGDGAVTRDEARALHASRFDDADADGDGALSLAEFRAQARKKADQRAENMFTRLDADGDGLLQFAEQSPRRGRFFDRMDADGDGVVTRAEADAAQDRFRKRHGGG